ncbi:hypothetical protein BDM02DRAFT_3132461 [Thelephora ganbajun]|uniref:Uncharacterized protein n=1 Tax=Thelephora ganbajun TaxID=370292 RepID=A0ACB6Z1Z0_THEGA|nr:hypothetical protein BDM02DRAFT_3132461 [Thelephora ganbajun]
MFFIDLYLPGHCLQFGNIMKSNLEMLYKGNLEALHCLKIKLGQTRKMDTSKQSKVQKFLAKNPLAKIVIILDTHSTQDGEIILMMYLPDEVKKFIESPSTIGHSHWTFILALTCGSHIMIEKARDSLTAQHCAEVVLSFGVGAIVPAIVSRLLPEFIIKWVAIPLPLMDIITHTMIPKYVERPLFKSAFHLLALLSLLPYTEE